MSQDNALIWKLYVSAMLLRVTSVDGNIVEAFT
jgi:hypothetical protein